MCVKTGHPYLCNKQNRARSSGDLWVSKKGAFAPDSVCVSAGDEEDANVTRCAREPRVCAFETVYLRAADAVRSTQAGWFVCVPGTIFIRCGGLFACTPGTFFVYTKDGVRACNGWNAWALHGERPCWGSST